MRSTKQLPVAIVTGASSGIGRQLAKHLSRAGYAVGVVARRRDALESLVEEIVLESGSAICQVADAGNHSELCQAVQAIESELGPCKLLVANAGVGKPTLLNPTNLKDVEEMIRVNLLGVVYAIDAVLAGMLKRGSGHLAAVSSLAAYKGLPGESAYCASKAGVNAYMEGLRIQLRGKGISVTTICPGFVETPMTAHNGFKMPWLLSADEAARRICRAIARKRSVYNFPWQTSLLMKLTSWVPDAWMAKGMNSYNENPPFPDP